MNDDLVISLEKVSKSYRIWSSPSARFGFSLWQFLAKLFPSRSSLARNFAAKSQASYHDFRALSELSLQVRRGECLGIIGRNGAGKSTLLQLIAGTLRPTGGEISVRGRVAALLELGSGFNPDFTGRENVHLNASILGLSKTEIEEKFDAIVAYSGIEEFIDQPVRTYSSGMTLRLAFSVCVHVDAEIIIIDEALAVGDARFAFKCHATLDQKLAEGRTIIFVSHDTNSVKRLCKTTVLLERGELLLQGAPNDVVNIYTKLITSPHGAEAIRDDITAYRANESQAASRNSTSAVQPAPAPFPASDAIRFALLSDERAHQQISDKEYAYGGHLGRIASVLVTDEHNNPRLSFLTASRLRLFMVCEALSGIDDPIYAITLKNERGEEVFGTNSYFQGQINEPVFKESRVEAVFELQLNIQPGVYFLSVGWVRLENAEVVVIHRRYDVIRFDVMPIDKSFGTAFCPTTITIRNVAQVASAE